MDAADARGLASGIGERRVTALIAAVTVLVAAGLLARTFDAPAPEMDEGTLVAYPTLVVDGAVAGRDFETFYGPGGPWLVAGAFEIFGPSVTAERLVGLAFRLAIVTALFMIALPWGRAVAAASALLSALIMVPLGIGATAWFGGLALACGALALMTLALVLNPATKGQRALLVIAGVASGLALAFRYDLAPAVVLSALPLLFRLRAVSLRPYLVGLLAGLLPLLVWLVLLGSDQLNTLADDIAASRPGRTLPLPSPTSREGQLLVATLAAAGLFLAVGAAGVRAARPNALARLMLAVGIFSALLCPSMLQRADDGHILAVACVPLALSPILAAEALRYAPRRGSSVSTTIAAVGACALAAFAASAIVRQTGASVRDDVLELGGGRPSYDVSRDGRSFPIESAGAARNLNAILSRIEPGEGDSLFVGPRDLRRTNYADTFLYYMLPELEPASFYTELNPGTANQPDSGLADDLSGADFLILAGRWDSYLEDNDSREYGSPEPNAVVARHFCPVAVDGTYSLLERCSAQRVGKNHG